MLVPVQPINRIDVTILAIEDRLFDAKKRPPATYWDPESILQKHRFAIPEIIKTYDLLKHTSGNHESRRERLYLLARTLVEPNGQLVGSYLHEFDQRLGFEPHALTEIRAIAATGRQELSGNTLSFAERLSRHRAFKFSGHAYAVQLRFPEGGCSASICSNCYEPVAFADQACPVCELEFIGPFVTPNRTLWVGMSPTKRTQIVQSVYRNENHGRMRIL